MSILDILKRADRLVSATDSRKELKRAVRLVKKRDLDLEKKYNKGVKDDLVYSKKGDVKLSEEEKKEIHEYWSKYSFAAIPDLSIFEAYYNRTGIKDPRFVPYYFRKFFRDDFRNPEYRTVLQDKSYLPKIYSKLRQPRTIVRRLENVFLDTDFEHISTEEAVKRCFEVISSGREIAFKATLSGGGGVSLMFIKTATEEELYNYIDSYGNNFIVQEAIMQHPAMAALNPMTVNCIRLVTFMFHGKIYPLSPIVKVGSPKHRVDNYKHGGHIIGVDLKTGRTNNWALSADYNRTSVLPSGCDLSDGYEIPFFDELVKKAIACHYEVPKMPMIGWDIAIDEEGPVLIEPNFACDYKMNQAVNGPLFGDLSDEVFDYFFLDMYYKLKNDKDWLYREHYDYIEIEKYIGKHSIVNIPASIDGKKVKSILAKAFYRNLTVKEVYMPDSVETVGKRIFARASSLKKVRLSSKVRMLPDETFMECESLEAVENLEQLKYIGVNCFKHCDKMPQSKNIFASIKSESK